MAERNLTPLRLEWRSPAELAENPANWRRHPEAQLTALTDVIGEVGWAGACLYNEATGRLIDGHARRKVALEQGTDKVPVLVGNWSEEQERKILATLDPLAAMAEADKVALDALLRDVQTGSQAVADMLTGLAAENGIAVPAGEPASDPGPQMDKAAELREKWGVVLGQVWMIPSKAGGASEGKSHRLMCGDSTKAEDVGRLMGGEKAGLMATDPPYGVDFEGAKYNPRAKKWAGIEGDKRQGNDLAAWLEGCLRVWFPYIAEDAAFYFWTAAMAEGAAAAAAIKASGLHIQSQIIWNKNCLVLGQADYHWKHENCWYAFWKGKKHRWFGERDKTTVWDVSKVANGSYEHPMQKPAELYAIPIRNHTHEGELVAEPFSGSGSQFAAAEQTGRLCYGMELEPKYVAVALERLTGMGLQPQLDNQQNRGQ